jgi:hypothetical protein
MDPFTASPGVSGAAHDWSVIIDQQGRGGTVNYREAGGCIPMGWEFGGNDVVAIISFENEASWSGRYPWAAGRRSEIVRRVAAEAIRQKAPGCRAEIDERAGWINLRQSSPPPPLPPRPDHQAFRDRKAKLMTLLAVIVLILAAAAIGFKSMFSVRSSSGTPLGLSLRTPEHIATLIQTLESYVPSLHRDPSKDRYRLALLLTPQDGSSPGKMIPLAQHRPAGEFSLVKLLGCDGTTLWFNLNGIGGVDLQSGKRIGEAELRRANPSLGESWDDQRRMEFDQRLRVTTADRQRVYEVTPETLQAVPAGPRVAKFPLGPALQDFLSSGVRPSPTEWLGLHSAKAAAGEYKPKARLSRLNRAEDAKELRSLYRAQLGPEMDRGNREILSQERVFLDEYFNAAFVRTGSEADPVRLSEPDSFLMIYTSKPGLGGTVMLARVDATGKILWKTDTGIERFKLAQILPDARFIAFTGTRPPVPDKVSEPILVIVDNQSGVASTVSLWQ